MMKFRFKSPSPGYLALAAMNVAALLISGMTLLGGKAFLVHAGILNPVTYAAVSNVVCNQYQVVSTDISFGCPSIPSTVTGAQNTAMGYAAGGALTSGAGNTAFGDGALTDTTTGSSDIGIGISALQNNTTGNNNIAIGAYALQATNILSNGGENVAIGYKAFTSKTSGGNDVALGYGAGQYISGGTTANTGSSASVFLGSNAWPNGATDTYEVVLGGGAVGQGSNTVTLGGTAETGGTYTYGGYIPGNKSAYGTPGLFGGTGAPTFSAPNGSLYMRYDGTTGSRLYGNTSGASTSGTTWTALAAP